MAKLVVYRQKRYDGGVRTGLDLNGVPLAEHFEAGQAERDSSLLWFVDLRCEGPGVPDDPDAAMDWLVEQADTVREGFARYAERLRVGADKDLYSLTWSDFPAVPEGVTMAIACSAVRRVDAREMSSILAGVGDGWDDLLHKDLGVPLNAKGVR